MPFPCFFLLMFGLGRCYRFVLERFDGNYMFGGALHIVWEPHCGAKFDKTHTERVRCTKINLPGKPSVPFF